MRIVVANHANSAEHLGGAELSLLAMLRSWSEVANPPEVAVISPLPEGAMSRTLRESEIREICVPDSRWASPRFRTNPAELARSARLGTRALQLIEDFIRVEKPDAVVTNTLASPWAAVAAARAGLPHFWLVREYGDLDHGLVFVAGASRTRSWIARLSRAVIANSHSVADHFQESARIATRPFVMHPPLPDVTRGVNPAQYDGGTLRLIVVSRLTPTKGLDIIPRTLRSLADSGVDACMTVVGAEVDRGYRARLEADANSLGVSARLRFTGETSAVDQEIRKSHIGISPGPWEAFGRTTQEYMSLGRPPIVSQLSGSSELLASGRFGAVFDPADPESLAVAIRRYALNPTLVESEGLEARLSLGDPRANAITPSDFLSLIGDGIDDPKAAELRSVAATASEEILAFYEALAQRVPRVLDFPARQAFRVLRIVSRIVGR